MTPQVGISDAIDLRAFAMAHHEATPRSKRCAARNGVDVRTERRWRTPADAKGSPIERHIRYLVASEDPWRVLALEVSRVYQQRLEGLTAEELLTQIREKRIELAKARGRSLELAAQPHVGLLDRALAEERCAALALGLTALYRACAVKRVPESEVFGS